MITHYSFHAGQIQSIGFDVDGRSVRAGAIAVGTYHFQIERPERMTVLHGELMVRRSGEAQLQRFPAGSTFDVSAQSELELLAEVPTAYLCELF